MKSLALFVFILVLAAIACEAGEGTPPTTSLATQRTSTEPAKLPPVTPSLPPATAPSLPVGEVATVSYIVDGDTIDVIINGVEYRVRYIGIDTPERDMPYFDQATQANRDLVEGQQVLLVKDVSETDRYGRLLRYIYLQDGTFVNAELVASGYAQAATFPPDVAFADLFSRLQEEARQNGRGLWAE